MDIRPADTNAMTDMQLAEQLANDTNHNVHVLQTSNDPITKAVAEARLDSIANLIDRLDAGHRPGLQALYADFLN